MQASSRAKDLERGLSYCEYISRSIEQTLSCFRELRFGAVVLRKCWYFLIHVCVLLCFQTQLPYCLLLSLCLSPLPQASLNVATVTHPRGGGTERAHHDRTGNTSTLSDERIHFFHNDNIKSQSLSPQPRPKAWSLKTFRVTLHETIAQAARKRLPGEL